MWCAWWTLSGTSQFEQGLGLLNKPLYLVIWKWEHIESSVKTLMETAAMHVKEIFSLVLSIMLKPFPLEKNSTCYFYMVADSKVTAEVMPYFYEITCICCLSYSRIYSAIKPAACVQQYTCIWEEDRNLRGFSLIRLFGLSTLLIVFPCRWTYIHCAELPLCNQAFAVGCDACSMSSSALCPHIPPHHLVVRWKIGETLFSLFPITQNRPGLLKWPLLHLPIGTEPGISLWGKKKISSFSTNHHN